MTIDKVLDERLQKMARAADVGGPTSGEIERRGTRRKRTRRGAVVLGVVVLLAAVGLSLRGLTDQEDGSQLETVNDPNKAKAEEEEVGPELLEPQVIPVEPRVAVLGDSRDSLAEYWAGGSTRSNLVPWGEGFVNIGIERGPSSIPGREADPDGVFPPEIWDVIEAAEATDLVSASAALSAAGLLGDATRIIRESDDVDWFGFLSPAPWVPFAATSTDGENWIARDTAEFPFEENRGVESDGERVVALNAVLNDKGMIEVAVTQDLVTWEIFEIDPLSGRDEPRDATVVATPMQLVVTEDYWVVAVEMEETVEGERVGSDLVHWMQPTGEPPRELELPANSEYCCFLQSDGTRVWLLDYADAQVAVLESTLDWTAHSIPGEGDLRGFWPVEGGMVVARQPADGGYRLLRADAGATNWVELDIPALRDAKRVTFGSSGTGVVAILEESRVDGFEPFDVTFEHDGLTATITGEATQLSLTRELPDGEMGTSTDPDYGAFVDGEVPAFLIPVEGGFELGDGTGGSWFSGASVRTDGAFVDPIAGVEPFFISAADYEVLVEEHFRPASAQPHGAEIIPVDRLLASRDGIRWSESDIDTIAPGLSGGSNGRPTIHNGVLVLPRDSEWVTVELP